MNDWEKALEKFLDKYKNEDYFLGAILTGSYVTGNNDENSDIDIYIVTKDTTTWRERGNKLIDGFLIEYFINPKKKVLSYFENELKDYNLSTTMIFVNGKIIYDKDGSIQELINIAKNNFNLKDIEESKYKMNCYRVWDCFDELESKYKKGKDIDFSYNIFLQQVIESYFYNKQIPSIPLNKVERILQDDDYRKKYNIIKLPDKEFIDLLLKCFDEKEYNKKYISAKVLYLYVLKQFNDFNINNFALKSEVENSK